MKKSATDDREARAAFAAAVGAWWPVAKGSLAEVRKPCIRPGCAACARGEKHPAFLFTYREDGRQRCLYVPRELAPAVRQALAHGRELAARLVRAGVEWIRSQRPGRRGPEE